MGRGGGCGDAASGLQGGGERAFLGGREGENSFSMPARVLHTLGSPSCFCPLSEAGSTEPFLQTRSSLSLSLELSSPSLELPSLSRT